MISENPLDNLLDRIKSVQDTVYKAYLDYTKEGKFADTGDTSENLRYFITVFANQLSFLIRDYGSDSVYKIVLTAVDAVLADIKKVHRPDSIMIRRHLPAELMRMDMNRKGDRGRESVDISVDRLKREFAKRCAEAVGQ